MARKESHTFRAIPLLITICLLSAPVYAKYSGGTGEPNDPYQIATADDLVALGGDANDYDKSFILTADIDLDPNLPGGRVFDDALIAPDEANGVEVHGYAGPFKGVFDGQGHTIANLHVSGKYGYDAGLFGMLGGLVKDVNFTDVVVSGSPCGAIAGLGLNGMILRCRVTGQVSGNEDVGGLAGSLWNAGVVDCQANVQVTGIQNVGGMVGGGPGGTLVHCEVQAQVSGQTNVGGLIGQGHDGQAVECRATGTVTGDDNVGGLIGISDRILIWTSSANCDVTATRTAGGLVGSAHWLSGPLIADCYAQGSVAGSVVGGLAGEARFNQFLNCYAACEMIPVEIEGRPLLVGGLYGDVSLPRNAPLTVACFWDAELSGTVTGSGSDALPLGTSLTTQQMQHQAAFENAGWDFDYIWTIREGQYPTLQWEGQN